MCLQYFNLFLLFRIVHGHSNVPYRFRNGSDFSLPKEIHRVPRISKGILIPNLGAWVNNQRALYRNGKVSQLKARSCRRIVPDEHLSAAVG